MPYVDGFIVAVPKKKLEAYVRLSKKCGKVWREYGALDYREWIADDVKVGKLTSFPRSVKLKPGETVVFAWITYKSRSQRDKINAKVMADPRLKEMTEGPPPFDGKRMIYGGFESLVKAQAELHELTDYSHVTVSAGQVVIHQCSFLYDGPLLSLQDRAALEWIGR